MMHSIFKLSAIKLCCLLSVLLILFIGAAAYQWIVRGEVKAGQDGRQIILLNSNERHLILSEMRKFLIAVQTIIRAANQDKMNTVAQAARQVGLAAQTEVPVGLIAKLPLEFKRLGLGTHRQFDQLALDAEQFGDAQQSLEQLTDLMNRCIACHATYRLESIDK